MAGWSAIYLNAKFALNQHQRVIARLQEQAATGARILRPSDGSSDAFRIAHLRSKARSIEAYRKNLDHVVLGLEEASDAVTQMNEALARVKVVLTQASSGTMNASNRVAIAEEVNSLLEECVSLANYNSLGRYLFGGSDVAAPPYVVARENGTRGNIQSVTYEGSSIDQPVPVAPGVSHSGLFVGEEVFRCDQRQAPVFYGGTGAAAGSTTSTVRGEVWLSIAHTVTLYDDPAGTGIAAGIDSPALDAILGAHSLTVDAAAGTIRLDDGPEQAIAGQTDLLLTNAGGDVAYVDVSGYTGLGGTVTLTGQGRMTIDDGATTTDLTSFTDNVPITDSTTGRVLWVNTTNVRRTGVESVQVPGTYDLFGTLIAARDLLLNRHALDEAEQVGLIQSTADELDLVMTGLRREITSLGGRLQAMDVLGESLETIKATATEQADLIADADMVEVATELARAQNFYEITLASTAKVMSLSLLDFVT